MKLASHVEPRALEDTGQIFRDLHTLLSSPFPGYPIHFQQSFSLHGQFTTKPLPTRHQRAARLPVIVAIADLGTEPENAAQNC